MTVFSAFHATQGAGAATIINPNRPESVVNPGTHTLSVVGFVDGLSTDVAQVTVIAKRGPAWPERGVIDLVFYFTGAQDWSAVRATAHAPGPRKDTTPTATQHQQHTNLLFIFISTTLKYNIFISI